MRLTFMDIVFFFLHLKNGSFIDESNRNKNQRTIKTPKKKKENTLFLRNGEKKNAK